MKAKMKKPGRVRAALLGWLGVPIQLTDSDFWSAYAGAQSSTGVAVNDKSMMQLSAVWACTRLIAETIATLPLSIYERTSSGKRVSRDHPLQFILHDQPNADSTAAVFWESVVAAMLNRGMAHMEKLIVGGRVVGLSFLAPARLSITRTLNDQKKYLYTDNNSRQREIPANRIFVIPGFSLDGKTGVSVIQYGANVFGSAMAAEAASAETFQNSLKSPGLVMMDSVLKKEQREEIREHVKKVGKDGGVMVLEKGAGFQQLSINPEDAQLLETRGFNVEEICRWFRVPPFMVGHSEKSTSWGTGIEQQMIGFLTFTLSPWLRRIEQAISKDLLAPAERQRFYPKFAVEGLLRADSAGRSAFYSAMVNNGILTRDEVRELEDREPMGGNAAVLTVQTSMAPLDDLGQAQDAAAVRAALKHWLLEPALDA